jgi:hypothetical protein
MKRGKGKEKPKEKRGLLGLLVAGAAAGGAAFALSARKQAAAPAPVDIPEERLTVVDEENLDALGRFMKALILNFLEDPGKIEVIETLNLAVAIEPINHPESALTMTFSHGHVVLENGIVPNPDIKVRCEPAVLLKVARMPAGPAAIKFLRSPAGKDIIDRFRSGELQVKGIPTHLPGIMKFSKLVAPTIN